MPNRVSQTCKLMKDPEVIETTSGTRITKLRVSFNHGYNPDATGPNKSKWGYANIATFNQMAERCAKYKKGDELVVFGELSYNEWDSSKGRRSELSIMPDREWSSVRRLDPLDNPYPKKAQELPQSQPVLTNDDRDSAPGDGIPF